MKKIKKHKKGYSTFVLDDVNPHDFYRWELIYGTEKLISEDGVNPERILLKTGEPSLIKLVPLHKKMPALECEIPADATPVCHIVVYRDVSAHCRIIGLEYRIGYKIGCDRFMKVIDLATGKVSETRDQIL